MRYHFVVILWLFFCSGNWALGLSLLYPAIHLRGLKSILCAPLLELVFCFKLMLAWPLLTLKFLPIVKCKLIRGGHFLGLHLIVELPDLRYWFTFASLVRRRTVSIAIPPMITRAVLIRVESRLRIAHLIARWSCLRLLLLPNSSWQIVVVSLHLLRFSFIDDMQVLVVIGVISEEVLVVADLLSHFTASWHFCVCLPYSFVLCCLQLLHVLFDDLTVPLRNLLAWGRRIAPCASRYFTRCEVVISSRAWSWVPTIGLLSLGYFPTLGCGIDLICDRGILLAFIRVDLRRRRIPSEDRSARLMTHTEWTLAISCCRVLW